MQMINDEKVNWNLKDIFETDEEFENSKIELKKYSEELAKFQGKLNNINDITNFYELKEKAYLIYTKLSCYVALKFHQDMSNQNSSKIYKDIESIGTEFSSGISFATPEISENSDEKLEEFIKDERLSRYKRSIKNIIKAKKHILNKDIEKILSKYSEVFGVAESAYDIFTTTEFEFDDVLDSNGEKQKMSHGLYSKYLASQDRTLRENAFESMYKPYRKNINTISELYLARVKDMAITAEIRNYKNSIDMATDNDDSKSEVYDCLVKEVNKNLNLNYEYMDLKRKMLINEIPNDDKVHMYDVYRNPLVLEDKNIEYNEAKEIVLNALEIIGKDYTDKLKEAMDNRWIDVYEKENKRTGAYSMGVYGVHPYVLLNYINSSRDVSTLAHELGHSMHSYYADTTQNVFDSNYTIMVAEVASTVNEMLLADYQIKNENDKMKKAYLINEQLDMIRATLYRQTMFAEFEKIVHEKIEAKMSLTSDDLNEIYYELVKKYFGESVVADESIKYEWARIPHFYSNFYVYKYATGITAATVIASKILKHEDGYVEKYIDMLSRGGSLDSLDLLKLVDVDLEKEETYEIAFKFFKEKLEELKNILN